MENRKWQRKVKTVIKGEKNIMSRLDELIQKLCPDGVATVPLGEVAHYAKTKIDASEMNENN